MRRAAHPNLCLRDRHGVGLAEPAKEQADRRLTGQYCSRLPVLTDFGDIDVWDEEPKRPGPAGI